jgi:hypothetical protein
MYIIPVPGGLVRNPRTKRLVPAEGMEVSKLDILWAHKRLAHGDVTLGEAPKADANEPVEA